MKFAIGLILVFLAGCAVQPPVVDPFMYPGSAASLYNH